MPSMMTIDPKLLEIESISNEINKRAKEGIQLQKEKVALLHAKHTTENAKELDHILEKLDESESLIDYHKKSIASLIELENSITNN